jgi:hypothetical protein
MMLGDSCVQAQRALARHFTTTQAGLASPKLPQPGANLLDIAAPPSICCRCVGAPEREAGILALAELVRDRRS